MKAAKNTGTDGLPGIRQTGSVLFLKRAERVFPFLLFFIAFSAYGNSLLNQFVYDDAGQIIQNPWITSARFLPDIFSSNVWGFLGMESNYYPRLQKRRSP